MLPFLIEIHKNKIVHFFHENMNSSTIAIIKNVSRRIIEKIRANLKTFKIHTSSKLKKMNKLIKMTSTMQTEGEVFFENQIVNVFEKNEIIFIRWFRYCCFRFHDFRLF